MGREYSHWIDLRLISHMKAVMFKIYLTKVRCFVKTDDFDVSTEIQKGPAAPQPICWVKTEEEGVELT